MNSPRGNPFGNHLTTATVGSNNVIDQPFPTNDLLQSKMTISKQSIEHLRLVGQHKYQHQPLVSRDMVSSTSMNHPPKCTASPNTSFSKRDTENESRPTSSQIESPSISQEHQHAPTTTNVLPLSPITTTSTIGLPSHYPGSVDHRSVLLEELQDFDDIFGRGQPSSSTSNSINHGKDKDNDGDDDKNDFNERESSRSRIESDFEGYDVDDDLYTLSRSSHLCLTLQNKGNLSEVSPSSSSADIPSSITITSLMTPPILREPSRSIDSSASSTCSNSSNYHGSTSTRPISRKKRDRRSRNLAMGSKEFKNAILEELEYNNY